MRALQVSHTAEPGGSNTVLLSLLRHAPEHVESACVFLEEGPMIDEVEALGVPTALVPSGRAREAWRARGVVRRLRAAVRTHRADVVLSHVNKAHLYAGVASRLEGVSAAWWQHEHLRLKPLLQRVAPLVPASAVICSADWIAAQQRSRSRADAVHVVHAGVEAEAIALAARDHTAAAQDRLTLGVVGRLARWKRAELAIRAMPAVRERLPEARLRVIGGGDAAYAAELEAECGRLGLQDAVELTGHVPDAGAALRDLDLLVHPAEHEPWGLVLLEALAAGVPVVAAEEGGPREIVRHGEDGLLVDPRDPSALADAIAELGADPQRRTRMGAAGRGRVLAHFTAERMADRLWRLLEEVA